VAMIELEPIDPGDVSPFDQANGDILERFNFVELFHDMSQDDERRLARLIQNHRHYTGSERAKTILQNWQTYAPKFVKVMPVEYRRALESMKPSHVAPHPPHHAQIAIGVNGR